MWRSIAQEVNKATSTPLLLAGVLVAFAGLLYAGGPDLAAGAASTDAFQVFRFAYNYNNSFWFLVVGAALPHAGSFCEDYQSKSFDQQIIRQGKTRYVVAKSVACAVAGAVVMVVAGILFFVTCLLVCSKDPMAQDADWRTLVGSEPFLELLEQGQIGLYWVFFFVAQACFGAFWALFGLGFSFFVPLRYVAYASPLIGAIATIKASALGVVSTWFNFVTLSRGRCFGGPFETLVIVAMLYLAAALIAMLVSRVRLAWVMARG